MKFYRREFIRQAGGLMLLLVTHALVGAKELRYDVAVIGGGMGGVAAALAALRNGMRVVLKEETDWIGGQVTAQSVPLDEHPWHLFEPHSEWARVGGETLRHPLLRHGRNADCGSRWVRGLSRNDEQRRNGRRARAGDEEQAHPHGPVARRSCAQLPRLRQIAQAACLRRRDRPSVNHRATSGEHIAADGAQDTLGRGARTNHRRFISRQAAR